jgi:hypothetical protein
MKSTGKNEATHEKFMKIQKCQDDKEATSVLKYIQLISL